MTEWIGVKLILFAIIWLIIGWISHMLYVEVTVNGKQLLGDRRVHVSASVTS